MEYGLMSTINQYADNHKILVQQVQPSSEIAKLNGDEAKEIQRDDFLKGTDKTSDKTSEVSEAKAISSPDLSQYKEVVLTNLNFGFNDSSREFFVRAVRGEAENQYPTDEMMKLKAYFIKQAREEAAAEAAS